MHHTTRIFTPDRLSVHLLVVALIISILFPAQFAVAGAAGKQIQNKRNTNGASVNPVPVGPFQSPVTTFTSVINLPTNDLVFNSQTQKIHASVPGTDFSGWNSGSTSSTSSTATSLMPRW